MNKSKSFLTGVILLALLLFSAGAALAADANDENSNIEIHFFSNPYPSLETGFKDMQISKFQDPGIKVQSGGKFFLGMYAKSRLYAGVRSFTVNLVEVKGDYASPDDVKITDMNGKELPYQTGKGKGDAAAPYLKSIHFRDVWVLHDNFAFDWIGDEEHFNQVFIDMANAKPHTTYIFDIILGDWDRDYYHHHVPIRGVVATVNNLKFICSTPTEELPSIDAPQTIMIEPGGMGDAIFTGKNIRSWYYKPEDIADKGIESITLEPEDVFSDNCRVKTKIAASVAEKTQINIPIYALNRFGDETSADLTIKVQIDEDHKPPVIDGNKSIEVVAGGTGTATFTGQYVKNWGYNYAVQPFIESVYYKYNKASPNVCEYFVKIKDDPAFIGKTALIQVQPYNGAGTPGRSASLFVKVTPGDKYSAPIIDSDESVTAMQGGTVTVEFTGKHTRSWAFEVNTPFSLLSKVDLDYTQDPARCEVKVTAHEDAQDGTYTANIYAYNAAGQMSEPRTLTVKVMKNEAHQTAVIDNDEAVSVTHGGSATAVFTGSHVRTWAADNIWPNWINGVDVDYSKNPNIARVTVTASSNAAVKAGETATINIYAYNGVGERSEPKTLTVTLVNDEAHEDPKIDEDELLTVVQGGTSKAVFTGQHIRSWGYATLPDAIKSVVMNYDTNPNRCEVLVTASSTAEVGDCEVTIYAYNAVGERVSAKLKVTVTEDTSHPDPIIDENESVTVVQGGTARAVFTGSYIRSWNYGNLPDEVKAVELKYDVNPNRCEVLVTASSNAEVGDTSITIYAYNDIGESTSADLTVTITEDRSHPDPVIDEDEAVTVIAGGTASAVFTGEHIRSWNYGNLPDEVKAVELKYNVNPNRCEVLVTASSTAEPGDTSITIFAYNDIGESTSATLNVTITEDTSHPDPVIDEDESVTVIAGGTARTIFTGSHVRAWNYGNLPDSVKAIELNYSTNPNRCEALVTASSTAQPGDTSITIYAYNEIGESTTATLNITIVADGGTHENPVINENEAVTVIAGGTAKAVFTGQHIRSWNYGNLPDEVKAVELKYNVNPKRCEVLVTASSTAEPGDTSITIFAYNEIGESATATLNITIVADGTTHDDPVINGNESVTVIAGGTAKAIFTGQHVRSWAYGNLPDSVKAIKLNYETNPNRCEALVTASSTAEAGNATVTIYAYNEIGEATSATLNITIVTDGTTYPDPVIDSDKTLTVVPGGISNTVFTGQNIAVWSYGNLPDAIKAIEMRYETNPNRCEVLVTASSTATPGTKCSVVIYAYNEVGESADKTLNISIANPSSYDPESDAPAFTARPASMDIVAGGSSSLVFRAKNVNYWRHDGDLPASVKAVEFRYDPENPGECEVIITASSTAKAGDSVSLKIYAGNMYDEVEADIKITIASESASAPVINEKTAKLTVAPGRSAKTTFTGTNISTWKYGNLPDGVTAIEFVYDTSNPNTCEVTVTASILAEEGDGGGVTITAYNSIGVSADATLTVSISEDGYSGDDGSDLPSFLSRHSSGCDMGFTGLGLLALSMMLFKARSKN